MKREERGGAESALGERHTLPIKGGKTREKTSTPSPGATGGGWVGGAEQELESPPHPGQTPSYCALHSMGFTQIS